MKSLEGFERVTLSYSNPIPISKKAFQIFHNINGSIRAVNNQGLISVQTKKLKGKSREVARIDTRNQQVTFELAIEDVPE